MKLTLHIGMGKTGTSAIQKFLNRETKALQDAGVLYTGIKLQAIGREFELSNQGDVGDPDKLNAGLNALENAMADRPDISHVIWSNESLSQNYNYKKVASVISEYAKTTKVFSEVNIILVLRRQDEWFESAYRQWGLKHKMYTGRRIMNVERYLDSAEPFLDYLSIFRAWSREAFNSVNVVEYGEAMRNGGMVRFIADYLSLPWKDEFEKFDQVHSSLGPSLSYLTATYNSAFHGAVMPEEFGRVIREMSLPEISPARSCYVSKSLRMKLLEKYRSDNNTIAREALGRDALFDETEVRDVVDYKRGKDDVIRYLLLIVRKQHQELSRMKATISSQDERISEIENLLKKGL